VATMRFEFEIGDATHLEVLLRLLREVDSVYDVHRVVPGGGGAEHTGSAGRGDRPASRRGIRRDHPRPAP